MCGVCVWVWLLSYDSGITYIGESRDELMTLVALEMNLWGQRDGSEGKGLAILNRDQVISHHRNAPPQCLGCRDRERLGQAGYLKF